MPVKRLHDSMLPEQPLCYTEVKQKLARKTGRVVVG